MTEIARMGGAQAIGALAYGTQSIPRVDKIVAPAIVTSPGRSGSFPMTVQLTCLPAQRKC